MQGSGTYCDVGLGSFVGEVLIVDALNRGWGMGRLSNLSSLDSFIVPHQRFLTPPASLK